MNIRRGDIFLADLNPTVGIEQAGTRPVLVVQCDLANQRIPSVTVVPLTSNLRAGRFLLLSLFRQVSQVSLQTLSSSPFTFALWINRA